MMAVEICHDARRHVAVMYCNTSATAFGPIFTGPSAYDDAEEFIEWLAARGPVNGHRNWGPVGSGTDPRDYTDHGLQLAVDKWRQENGVTV